MDVCTDDFGNAPCEEIPNDNSAIVAAHSQQGAPAIEGAGEGHTDTVQSAICLLHMQKNTTQNYKKKLSGLKNIGIKINSMYPRINYIIIYVYINLLK